MHVDAAVARLAARQHGLLTRSQVSTCGVTDRMIHERVASARWVPVARGVYRLAGVPVTWNQRALAACLLAGPGAVVSHRSAAVVWGVSGFRPGRVEITVPPGASARSTLARVHRSVVTGVRRDGVPVTQPARTIVDLAGVSFGDSHLVHALDLALGERSRGRALDLRLAGARPQIVRLLTLCGLASLASTPGSAYER